ncbi:MAG: cell division/cell wall cluster transcriptional repressor MraZ [Prevotella sp.]|nr:cell division/cell wall cluster transcriptional repressor MraZ [Prevotella sp.]
MRFFGNIEAKTDAKGRVFLPAVFRKELMTAGEEVLVMRKDIHQTCLTLYPESVWNEQLDALNARLNRWNATHRQVLRQYMTDVELLTLDGNGRLLLPRRYLQMAGIGQAVLFKGLGDTIEMWSPDEENKARMTPDVFAKTIEELMADETAGE